MNWQWSFKRPALSSLGGSVARAWGYCACTSRLKVPLGQNQGSIYFGLGKLPCQWPELPPQNIFEKVLNIMSLLWKESFPLEKGCFQPKRVFSTTKKEVLHAQRFFSHQHLTPPPPTTKTPNKTLGRTPVQARSASPLFFFCRVWLCCTDCIKFPYGLDRHKELIIWLKVFTQITWN